MLSLEETLGYENPRLLEHFTTYYFAMSDVEVRDVFTETKRWLWLCAKAYADRQANDPAAPKTMNVQAGMVVIDCLWHIFVIHTRDYANFCQKYFGKFIHHSPSHPDFKPPTLEETELQMSYIYDNAGGEAVLRKWYVEYAERYSPERIRSIQIPFHVRR